MSMSYDTNINNFEVNMFEYCTLMEDLKMPGSKTAYVKVHKLMPYCNNGDKSSSDSIFVNDNECKPNINSSFEVSDSIQVSIFNLASFEKLGKPIYSTMTDQEGTKIQVQTGTIIPKGTLMIVMFMDNNINDAYLTNFIAGGL